MNNIDERTLQLFEEVARINMKETDIFPCGKYEITIQSQDYNPPHLHIKSDGWNIAYEIETGREIEIIERGKQRNVYEYITKNVVKWLDNKCSLIPKITNRENAMAQWIQLHEEYEMSDSELMKIFKSIRL